jgi:hypothetical protein
LSDILRRKDKIDTAARDGALRHVRLFEAAPVAYNNGDSVAYCEQTFRSYDPASGSYLGYGGFRHACPWSATSLGSPTNTGPPCRPGRPVYAKKPRASVGSTAGQDLARLGKGELSALSPVAPRRRSAATLGNYSGDGAVQKKPRAEDTDTVAVRRASASWRSEAVLTIRPELLAKGRERGSSEHRTDRPRRISPATNSSE